MDLDRVGFDKQWHVSHWETEEGLLMLPAKFDLPYLVTKIAAHPRDASLLICVGKALGLINDQIEKALLAL
jgi:hypothetical protein